MTDKKSRREALELFRLKARPMLDALFAMSDHLETVESLDQAAHEAEARRAAAQKAEEDARVEVERLQAEMDALLTRAKADTARVAQEAKSRAEARIQNAEQRALEIIADAQAQAARVLADAMNTRAEAQAELDRSRDDASGVRAATVAMRAEQAALADQIEKARAVVRSLMGA